MIGFVLTFVVHTNHFGSSFASSQKNTKKYISIIPFLISHFPFQLQCIQLSLQYAAHTPFIYPLHGSSLFYIYCIIAT